MHFDIIVWKTAQSGRKSSNNLVVPKTHTREIYLYTRSSANIFNITGIVIGHGQRFRRSIYTALGCSFKTRNMRRETLNSFFTVKTVWLPSLYKRLCIRGSIFVNFEPKSDHRATESDE